MVKLITGRKNSIIFNHNLEGTGRMIKKTVQKGDHHILTEWRLQTKASDIPVYLYWMPQKSMEAGEIEKETGRLKYILSQANRSIIVESAAHLLGSFEEIKVWKDVRPLRYERRTIDLTSSTERRLLKRLLSKSLKKAQNPQRFKVHHRRPVLIFKQGHHHFKDWEATPVLHFDITVCTRGFITVGFDLSHDFTHRKNLYDLLQEGSSLLTPGCKVKDIVKQNMYTFKKVLDKPVSYPHLNSGENLIEYYQNQGLGHHVKSIPPDTPAVSCTDDNGKDFTFIPQLLKLVCTWENVPWELKKKVKLRPNKRITGLIDAMSDVLEEWKQKEKHFSVQFDNQGYHAEQNGYRVLQQERPNLVFGSNVTAKAVKFVSPYYLEKGGVLNPPSQPLKIQFLIDEEIIKDFTREKNGQYYFPFFNMLKNISKKMGVLLEQAEWNRVARLHFDQPIKMRRQLREIAQRMQPESPLLIVAKEENLNKNFGSDKIDFYNLLKRELGRDYALRTQVVTYETFKQLIDPYKRREFKQYVITNLLLGIYVKMGIHPWKLQKPLHSDCMIGLDVYHDDDIHITGVIQVVGKDGLPLWTKPLSNAEKGEVIRRETIEELLFQTLDKFKQENGRCPKHLTFHRDGKGHESEIRMIGELLDPLDIQFDYVSIRKKINRRMAYKSKENIWQNPFGFAYVKEEERSAMLCTTDPRPSIGMAQPFRVIQMTDCFPFGRILDDIYQLTFMNFHALNPSRLPSTINYADKTASFFAQRILPMDKEMPIQSV